MAILQYVQRLSPPVPTRMSWAGRPRYCVALAAFRSDDVLLDVGCTTGWLLAAAQPMVRRAVGVDSDIEAARLPGGQPSGLVVGASAQHLPFPSQMFTLITLLDVIEHLPEQYVVPALKELRRVMHPAVPLLLTTPAWHWINNLTDPAWPIGHRHYRIEQLQRALHEASFAVLTSETRGRVWSATSALLLYIWKWLLRQPVPETVGAALDRKIDKEFLRQGWMTHFICAVPVPLEEAGAGHELAEVATS